LSFVLCEQKRELIKVVLFVRLHLIIQYFCVPAAGKYQVAFSQEKHIFSPVAQTSTWSIKSAQTKIQSA